MSVLDVIGSLHNWRCSVCNIVLQSGPEVIKLFSCSTRLSLKFSLIINMKTPTIVDIFIFISKENFMLSYV